MTERQRAKVAENVAEYLREGEVVQAAIFGQNARGGRLAGKYYWIVATNERIILFNAGAAGVAKIKGLDRELPRETQIGPPTGKGSLTRTWYRSQVFGESVYIPRSYWGEVKAADAAIATE